MINIRYVLVEKMAELTGYTPKAIDKKIDDGIWIKGREWIKAPDGRRFVDVEGFNKWVENIQGPDPAVNQALKSLSTTKGKGFMRR